MFVDPTCYYYNHLEISGATITNKRENSAYVFSLNRLLGQYQYTVTFKKICNYVALGVIDSKQKSSTSIDLRNRAIYASDSDFTIGAKW